MTEKALEGSFEQYVIALVERRQRIMDEANKQITPINKALAQVVQDAARAAGLDETRTTLDGRPTGLVLVEAEADEEGAGRPADS